MLNPIQNAEAIYSATYVDNYIDSVENLPDDVARILSRIRDIDVQYRTYLRDVDHYYDLWKSLQNGGDTLAKKRQSAVSRMQQSLIKAQELGDEKMQIVNQLQEIIDFKTRQLDTDQKNLDIKEELAQPHRLEQLQSHADDCSGPTQSKQTRTQSPARVGEPISGSANGGNSGNLGGAGSVSSGGGSSTPNSDRSSHVSNSAHNFNTNSSGISANANNSSALVGSESYRSASKRSRRRNENTNSNMHVVSSGLMELGGNNESNSANEGGGSNGGGGSERHASQKNTSGASQKNQSASGSTASAAGSSAVAAGGSGNKKKKRKARGTQSSVQANAREDTPPPDPIDPDEPTYCVCNQISFGEMILCDNDLCPIEWFHFSCVSLVFKPKGRWYCPNCRGDRPNVMKPKAQFLKELERYNKEKEEKT